MCAIAKTSFRARVLEGIKERETINHNVSLAAFCVACKHDRLAASDKSYVSKKYVMRHKRVEKCMCCCVYSWDVRYRIHEGYPHSENRNTKAELEGRMGVAISYPPMMECRHERCNHKEDRTRHSEGHTGRRRKRESRRSAERTEWRKAEERRPSQSEQDRKRENSKDRATKWKRASRAHRARLPQEAVSKERHEICERIHEEMLREHKAKALKERGDRTRKRQHRLSKQQWEICDQVHREMLRDWKNGT